MVRLVGAGKCRGFGFEEIFLFIALLDFLRGTESELRTLFEDGGDVLFSAAPAVAVEELSGLGETEEETTIGPSSATGSVFFALDGEIPIGDDMLRGELRRESCSGSEEAPVQSWSLFIVPLAPGVPLICSSDASSFGSPSVLSSKPT